MRVRFWGTRGSIATPGPVTNHFGGNTYCVEVLTDDGARLILDCGTGAHRLGAALMAEGKKDFHTNILLGHTHWDHIQGFPFFTPAFVKGNSSSGTQDQDQQHGVRHCDQETQQTTSYTPSAYAR